MIKNIFVSYAFTYILCGLVEARDLVLVIGGTGRTGWHVVEYAIKSDYEVRATTRDISKASNFQKYSNLNWIELDIREPEQLSKAMSGVNYVVSTVGGACRENPNSARYVDYEGLVNIANAIKGSEVSQLVVTSSVNAGLTQQSLNEFCGNTLIWKWLGEDYVRDSGLNYTIVRPGGLDIGKNTDRRIRIGGDRAFTTGVISRVDVAQVLIDVLGDKDAYLKTLEIISGEGGSINQWQKNLKLIPSDPIQKKPLSFNKP
jgi:uncharacterized protein YbjT (DUF2867 family)